MQGHWDWVDTTRGSPHAERLPCDVVLGEVPANVLVAVSSDFA